MALKIQRYSSNVGVPKYSPTQIPSVTSDYGYSIGKSIEGLGRDVSRFTKAMKTTRQNMELAEAESDLFVEFSNYESELENATDYKALESDHPEYISQIKKRFGEQLGHDPEIQAKFDPYFRKKIAVLNSRVRARSRSLQIDEGRGKLATTLENLEYGTSSIDDEERAEAYAISNKAIDNAVAGGLITHQEAQSQKDALEERSEANRAKRWIDVSPEEALADIRAGEFKVSPEVKLRLEEEAKITIKQNEALEKAQKKEEELKLKKEEEQASKEEEFAISQLFLQKKYTEALNALGNTQHFKDGTKIRVWTKAINAELDRKDKEWESDPDTRNDFKVSINTEPEKFNTDELWNAVGKKRLTADDAEALQETFKKRLADTPRAKRMKLATESAGRLRTAKLLAGREDDYDTTEDFKKANEDAFNKVMDDLEALPNDTDPVEWLTDNVKIPAETAWYMDLINTITTPIGNLLNPQKTEKIIVQTGTTKDGRKVIKYSDGSVEYAD